MCETHPWVSASIPIPRQGAVPLVFTRSTLFPQPPRSSSHSLPGKDRARQPARLPTRYGLQVSSACLGRRPPTRRYPSWDRIRPAPPAFPGCVASCPRRLVRPGRARHAGPGGTLHAEKASPRLPGDAPVVVLGSCSCPMTRVTILYYNQWPKCQSRPHVRPGRGLQDVCMDRCGVSPGAGVRG